MSLSKESDNSRKVRWLVWRNRVLASDAFQRFAVRNPLLRLVARRRASALFDLVAGFVYAQILAACIELGLLEHLADGAHDLTAIAQAVACPEAQTVVLLRAAASLGLVERVGARWTLGVAGAAVLGNRGIAEMVAHHRLLYADLADPVALIRRGGGGGALAGMWRYAEAPGSGDHAAVAAYSALMAASQPLVADHILDAYRFGRHAGVLDIGGGEGVFLAALGARYRALALGLVDLPAVCERAADRLQRQGMLARARLHPGNFRADPLPQGYDCMTLVRVLHDHDDAPALALLTAIRAALPPGGTLLIAEPMTATPGAEPSGDAYFGFYLMAMGSGRPRRPDEIGALLKAAGFARWRLRSTALPLTLRLIVATR